MAEHGSYPATPRHRGAPPPTPPTTPRSPRRRTVAPSCSSAAGDQVLRHRVRLGRTRLDHTTRGIRSLQHGSGSRPPTRHLRRRRRLGRPLPKSAGRRKCPCPWNSTRLSIRPGPCAGSVRTRSPRRAGPHPRCGHPSPSGGNQQNWRFLLLDDPAKKAALAPLYQHAMGELWETIYKPPDRGRRGQPRGGRLAFRCARSNVRPNGWGPTTSSRCLSTSSRSASTTRPVALSIPPSGTPCGRPGGGRGQLPAIVPLQFFPPGRDVRDTRGPQRPGLDPFGHRQLSGSPDGLPWGVAAPAARCTRSPLPQRLGFRRRLRNPRASLDRFDRQLYGAVRRHRAPRPWTSARAPRRGRADVARRARSP